MRVCACVCVLVNNSHLFIGLKLYTMKASQRQVLLFGCQKEKLKEKKRREGLLEIFLPFPHPLCLYLLMINDRYQLNVLEPNTKEVKKRLLKIFLQEKGPLWFLENDMSPQNHINFQLNPKGD